VVTNRARTSVQVDQRAPDDVGDLATGAPEQALLRAKSRRLNRVASTPAGDQRREPVLVVLLLDERECGASTDQVLAGSSLSSVAKACQAPPADPTADTSARPCLRRVPIGDPALMLGRPAERRGLACRPELAAEAAGLKEMRE
jgi:hypothetical protein